MFNRRLKREISNISLNLDASLETARAGLDQLHSEKLLNIDKTAECLATLIGAVEKQNERLRKAANRKKYE